MKDMAQGSIRGKILVMAVPVFFATFIQHLSLLVELYFVSPFGGAAGVTSAVNATLPIVALNQVLTIGAVALISRAVGRKDQADANVIFNQALLLTVLFAMLVLVGGYSLAGGYMRLVAADTGTAVAGITFLRFYLPSWVFQFALYAMGSALRGTGIVYPTVIAQILTLLLNILLAPILIAGWGTGKPFGVAGAGLATTLAYAAGAALMAIYFLRIEKYVSFDRTLWAPRLATWRQILGIGLPVGGEYGLMFVYTTLITQISSRGGESVQAGVGIGWRVIHAVFLPAMAIAFTAAPIAGQNLGAKQPGRVRETLRECSLMGGLVMLTLALFCQWRPDLLVRAFTVKPQEIEISVTFLRIFSWNFIALSLISTCSGMFQALENTWPSLLSTGSRLVTFALPTILLSYQDWFRLRHVLHLSLVAIVLQAIISLLLVRSELRKKLGTPGPPSALSTA